MIRAALRINQLSQDATGWYAGYLAALDSGDVDAYAQFLSPDCVVTINNNLPYDAIGEIKAQMALHWRHFTTLRHEPVNIYGADTQFAVEMICHYVRRDGKRASAPLATFVDRGKDGRATMINIYIDPKPQFV